MESVECMREPVLDRLVKHADVKDIVFVTGFGFIPGFGHDISWPVLTCDVRWHDTSVSSSLISTSRQWFRFQVPELAAKVLNEEVKHDIASKRRCVIHRSMLSPKVQQEIVKQMIACKRPSDELYVEKYPDWKKTVIVPAVSCLEELEMTLDLDLC